jgi:hypothetical protein
VAKIAKGEYDIQNAEVENMKSFKEYQPKSTNAAPQENTSSMGNTQNTAEELTKKIASAYNGKSNADMMRSILMQAEKGKRDGTLTNEEIENFYRSFAPMLDNVQRKKLRAIVDRLKGI